MPFTDRSDIYIALNEAGINRAIRHVMRQRPSLFNYATARVIGQPDLWCRPIDVHPVVTARGNPVFTEVPAVPILGTRDGYAVDAVAQLGQAAVDLSPVNVLAPPAELGPLPRNSLAAMAEFSAALGCPSELPVPRPPTRLAAPARVVLGPGAMTCFTLQVFGFGRAAFTGAPGDEHIQARLLEFDTVEISPQGLEDAIDCYVRMVVQLGILPQLAIPTIRFAKDLLGLVHVVIEPSTAVPENPLIEEDELKVFLAAAVSGLPPAPPPPPGSRPEHTGGIARARTRTGPFDLIGAVSKAVVVQIFQQILAGYQVDKAGSKSFGPFTASYHVRAHAEHGTVVLADDGTVGVKDLDIKWDTLELCLGIDIPEICIGGFCIIPTPFGCALRAPKLCVFSASPDLQFCLELGGFLHSKLSLVVRPVTRYRVDPGRTSAMNDWDARDAGVPSLWQVIASPVSIDFELIDISATVEDLFGDAINDAIDALLGPLPGWAKSLIRAILGPVVALVRGLLGIADDLEQWLIDLIGNLGVFDLLLDLLSGYFDKHPLAELPDPFPILGEEPARIAVMLPIEFLGVQATSAELVVNADLGGVP
jgi:hypothetical protein